MQNNIPEYQKFFSSLAEFKDGQDCPIIQALVFLQGKWHSRIIFFLLKNDTLRFGELKKRLPPITNTVLANSLKELEQREIIARKQFNEVPPHVEYSLTERGKSLLPVYVELGKWQQNTQTH